MGRRLRGVLPVCRDLLVPSGISSSEVRDDIVNRRIAAKEYYDKQAGPNLPDISVGNHVYVKPAPRHRGNPWQYGQVTRLEGPRSFVVQTDGGQVRRNRVQVRLAAPPGPKSSPAKAPIKVPFIRNVSPLITPCEESTALESSLPQSPNSRPQGDMHILGSGAQSPALRRNDLSESVSVQFDKTDGSVGQSPVPSDKRVGRPRVANTRKTIQEQSPLPKCTRSGRMVVKPVKFDPSAK